MKVKLSAQAMVLIRQARDFDMDEFLSYLTKDGGFPIGSSNVVEYLLIRDGREFGDHKPKEVEIDGSKL